jgi:DnaJ-class molecular chaperone
MNNPIHILGLKRGDTLEIAKKKRNALFLHLHPDKNKKNNKKYQEVYDAYEYLKENPNLLVKDIILESIGDSLKVMMKVNIEDIYFQNTKNVTIERKILCHKCAGTRSKGGIQSYCHHCNGEGEIKSNILTLLDKSTICPKCKGIGINPEDVCETCRGSGYETEYKSISFKLTLYDYQKKIKIINDAGNQLSHNKFGRLIIHIKVIENPKIRIEDDYFVVYDKVLPIQKIIGDKKIINIFGRDVHYTIPPNSTEAYALDKISKFLTQEIRIKFVDILPEFTEKTIILYKKILEMEKKNINNSSPLI